MSKSLVNGQVSHYEICTDLAFQLNATIFSWLGYFRQEIWSFQKYIIYLSKLS